MTELSNIRLAIDDIGKDIILISKGLTTESPIVSYKLVGRDTQDKLTNKDLTDPSNNILATGFSAGGTPIPVTDGAINNVLTRTATGAEFALNNAHGFRTATSIVSVSSAAAPVAGEALVATGPTSAVWTRVVPPYSDLTTSIADATDPTKILRFDVAGSTGTTTTLRTASLLNRTLTLPDVTDTLVSRISSDTLFNKTIINPIISNIINGTGNLTLPANTTTTLVGRNTLDTLTNKVLAGSTNFVAANSLKVNAAGTILIDVQSGAAPPGPGYVLKTVSTIRADWALETVTALSSAGGTFSLVNDGIGPILANKGINVGPGVAIVDSSTAITIAAKPGLISANVASSHVADLYSTLTRATSYLLANTSFPALELDVFLPTPGAASSAPTSTTAVLGDILSITSELTSVQRFRVFDGVATSYFLHPGQTLTFTAVRSPLSIPAAVAPFWSLVSARSDAINPTGDCILLGPTRLGFAMSQSVVIKPSGSGTNASNGVFIGRDAGNAAVSASTNAIAIGYAAASSSTVGANSISIGVDAARFGCGDSCVAIGTSALRNAANALNPLRSIAIGAEAGYGTTNSPSDDTIFIGYRSGQYGALNSAILIGREAGAYVSGQPQADSIAIGRLAGAGFTLGASAIAIGTNTNAATSSIVIGANSNSGTIQSSIILGISGIATVAGDILIGGNITTTLGASSSVVLQYNASATTFGQECVIIGKSNVCSVPISSVVAGIANTCAGAATTGAVIFGRNNAMNSTLNGSNNVLLGSSNVIAFNSTSQLSLIGYNNAAGTGSSTSVAIGNGNSLANNSSSATAIGINNNVSAGAVAMGFGCSATGVYAAALGNSSRAITETSNIATPLTVRVHTAESQLVAHRIFGGGESGYSTVKITADGMYAVQIPANVVMAVTGLIITNAGLGNGSFTVSVGDSGDLARFVGATPVVIAAQSCHQIRVANGASPLATSAGGISVTISAYTSSGATFIPRCTMTGLLLQTA